MEEIEAQHGDTYVLDPESPVEMARLINLDRIITKAMGGPLSGTPDLPEDAKVLDLACGPGGWVLDTAFARPDIEVAGVDVSKTMMDYARARARTQQLLNASFEVMDITKPLEFSDQTFDLVNARLLVGVVRRETWPLFLAECTRILKPGGQLRLTELTNAGYTSSVAFNQVSAFISRTLWQAGYGFSVDGHDMGIVTVFPRMLRRAGYQHVQCHPHILEFSADCEAWVDMRHNMQATHAQQRASLEKLNKTMPEDLDQLYQQADRDMLAEDFCGMWHVVTITGEKPSQEKSADTKL
jgi:ubiquinone/menaquinone biosynthesis C-methylase UbiE